LFTFITHRPLWVNLLAGFILALLIFILFILSLNWLTHHGSSKTVPGVVGKKYDEARKQLEKSGFEVEVQDSVYIDTIPPLSVIKQFPDENAEVKVNRKVFLTITRTVPPEVEMPNLVGYSFRSAEMVLKNMGLRVGDIQYKNDFAKNSVLQQLLNGNEIAPGTKLKMGNTITLVLGNGLGAADFPVPYLLGMKYADVKTLLESNGIIGNVVVSPADTLNAFAYKQNPERTDETGKLQRIRSGQMMDIWLQKDKPMVDTIHRMP
jgi:hypothetical protein